MREGTLPPPSCREETRPLLSGQMPGHGKGQLLPLGEAGSLVPFGRCKTRLKEKSGRLGSTCSGQAELQGGPCVEAQISGGPWCSETWRGGAQPRALPVEPPEGEQPSLAWRFPGLRESAGAWVQVPRSERTVVSPALGARWHFRGTGRPLGPPHKLGGVVTDPCKGGHRGTGRRARLPSLPGGPSRSLSSPWSWSHPDAPGLPARTRTHSDSFPESRPLLPPGPPNPLLKTILWPEIHQPWGDPIFRE